jgi:mannuronan 5-epimerase
VGREPAAKGHHRHGRRSVRAEERGGERDGERGGPVTERLQDLFGQMLDSEPPLAATHGSVLGEGRRLRRRRKLLVRTSTAGLAALALVAGGLAAMALRSAPVSGAPGYPVPDGALFVAPAGSDSAGGGIGAPLRTLAAAVARVPAGGTVVLRGGTYREGLGGIDKRVTIQPYGTEQVWIKGSDVLPSWAPDGGAWRAVGWTSPLCQTCYPAGAVDSAHPLAGKPDQVFRNGTPLAQVGSRAQLRTGTFFIDPASLALYVGSDPTGATMEASTRWRALQLNAGAAGSVLRGLHFSEYAPHWNEDQLAAVIVAAPNAVVENNTFTRSATRSLGVFAAGVTVRGNSVVDNGGPGATVNRADGVVVEDNDFSRNNDAHYGVGGCGAFCTMAGLKVAHTAGLTVRHNTFAANDGSGFWCDLGCTDGTITGNTVTGNSNNGLFWEVSARASITGNTVRGNGRGIKISGSDRVTVTGNVVADNGTQLGVYDDARPASTDSYSAGRGLSWNTTGAVVSGNTFAGGTGLLLDTNRTAQVAAPGMFATLAGNTVAGTQRIQWCPSSCTRYADLAAFAAASGFPFGTATAGPDPTSSPTRIPPSSSSPPPASSSGPTPPPARQYLADPGFDSDPLWWRTFGPATTLAPVTAARTGGHALRVTGTGQIAGTTGTSATLRTVVGHRYAASCWVRSASPVSAILQLQEYTLDWLRVSDPVHTPALKLAEPNRWYQLTVTYTATRPGNQLPLSVFATTLGGTQSMLVDDCSLTDG